MFNDILTPDIPKNDNEDFKFFREEVERALYQWKKYVGREPSPDEKAKIIKNVEEWYFKKLS
jgi:hypothetical protein